MSTILRGVEAPEHRERKSIIRSIRTLRRTLVALTMSIMLPLALTSCSSTSGTAMVPSESTATTVSDAPFSAHFEVDQHEIVTGTSGRGAIVLVNRTGATIISTACPVSLYQTDLIGNGHQSDSNGLACAGHHEIGLGETRLPLEISTMVGMCSQPPSTRFVPCLAGGTHPPLAPGEYDLTAWSMDPSLPVPAPIKIRLVN